MFRITRKFFPAFFILLITILFQVLLKQFKVPRYLVPLPSEVLSVLWNDKLSLFSNFLITLQEWSIGVFFSILLGLLFSILSLRFKLMHNIISPILIISQCIPYLVFVPLLMIWLGLGLSPKIVLVILTCTFPIALVMQKALFESFIKYELIVKMLQLSFFRALIHIYIPYSLSSFFNALKISMSYSFGSAVLAELMGSESGLGVYLLRSQSTYRTDQVIAVVVIVVTFSLFSVFVINILAKKIMFWKEVTL